MTYTVFKATHVTCVLLTFALFFTRGVWMIRNPGRLRLAWVRVLPHVVDSMLLISAIGLVVTTGQYPGSHPWLDVKIICLIVYIGLGMAAFRYLHRLGAKITAWILAQIVFVYIVMVAVTRSPVVL